MFKSLKSAQTEIAVTEKRMNKKTKLRVLLLGIIIASAIVVGFYYVISSASVARKKVNMEIEIHYYNDYNSTALTITALLYNPTSNTLYNCVVNVLYVNSANQNAETAIPVGNVAAQPNFNSPQQISFIVNNMYMTTGYIDESSYIKLSAYGYTKP